MVIFRGGADRWVRLSRVGFFWGCTPTRSDKGRLGAVVGAWRLSLLPGRSVKKPTREKWVRGGLALFAGKTRFSVGFERKAQGPRFPSIPPLVATRGQKRSGKGRLGAVVGAWRLSLLPGRSVKKPTREKWVRGGLALFAGKTRFSVGFE